MGLFSGISKAFNSISESLHDAFDSYSGKIQDIFYSPKDDYREREDIKVSTPKDVYDTWLIEQNLGLDFGIWDDYKELFTMGDTP